MEINCLIIEDEPLATYILEQYISQTPFLHTAKTLERIQDIANIVHNEQPDIVFLDINTKGVNKFEIQELTKDRNILLIFTTAYPKSFIEDTLQIDLSELGYLHKPIYYEEFLKELERVIQ